MTERYVKGEYNHQSLTTDSPNHGELPNMSVRIACDQQELESIDEDVGSSGHALLVAMST